MKKKVAKKVILGISIAVLGSILTGALFVGSVAGQFGYNMLFVKPVVNETTKGGDGKLNTIPTFLQCKCKGNIYNRFFTRCCSKWIGQIIRRKK